ncbi:hypothetical protein SUGI_1498670 [Cryptomeria japonica]|uniref:Uncharacterized protein n=1 Tax=Cryptomeria japonica TaxID=3369 RepID=A0AAD3RPZ5_CRYJA|nr:hypothetical protein SUGI_1498670 [Cryptomeria japonica]
MRPEELPGQLPDHDSAPSASESKAANPAGRLAPGTGGRASTTGARILGRHKTGVDFLFYLLRGGTTIEFLPPLLQGPEHYVMGGGRFACWRSTVCRIYQLTGPLPLFKQCYAPFTMFDHSAQLAISFFQPFAQLRPV